ncbi:DUF5304 domain-containing protein [Streptomyces sp. TR06-5]|uniref:DUF5304 domain-containing protein n=1 Tax=unclassified Streptomyces TaxID=2593676 RepID=UPI0039A16AF0
MSDASERPGAHDDADPWGEACAEDLAAERDRHRSAHGPQPVSAAEELRKLADAVSERFAGRGRSGNGNAGAFAVQGFAEQFLDRARAAVEPVMERNPQVFDHLAAAGTELAAAYRAAVQGQEQRWSSGPGPQEPKPPKDGTDGTTRPDDGEGPPGPERIDLD